VVHNDKFYIIAGNTIGHSGGYVPWLDEYDPLTGTWTPLADAPRARDHFHAAVINNKLYVAGGRQSQFPDNVFNQTIAEVDVYDFATGTWSTLGSGQNLPTPRGGATVAQLDGKLLVIGGEVQNQEVYGTLVDDALKITEQYDPVQQTWTRLSDLNSERHGTQAIVSGEGVYIVGGSPNRGGGNQKNMEYLGSDTATGIAGVASTLSTPSIVQVQNGTNTNIQLEVSGGNTGIIIKSVRLSGEDAAEFNIESGNLNFALLKPNTEHSIQLSFNGTEGGKTADLIIDYGAFGEQLILLEGNLGGNQPPVAVATAIPTTGTAPLNVSFTGSASTDDGGIVEYLWDFKDGATSNLPDPAHIFTQAGTYEVSLTVTDAEGSEHVSTITISVSPGSGTQFSLLINSGGPALTDNNKDYVADVHFSGGNPYSKTTAQVPALYQTERSSPTKTFSYAIPLENGDYTIILHFAEIYWGATGGGPGGVGRRIFDVAMEGTLIMDNYDITADVGAETPVAKTFAATVSDGVLNLTFSSLTAAGGVDQPKVSAIEIYGTTPNQSPEAIATAVPTEGTAPLNVSFTGSGSTDDGGIVEYLWDFKDGTTSNLADPTHIFTEAGSYGVSLTVTDAEGLEDSASVSIVVDEEVPPQDFSILINAGGPALTDNGKDYSGDVYFTGGNPYSKATALVPALYQTERSAPNKSFSYAIPLENREYTVVLHFAEIYWGATGGGPGGVGRRIFDVAMEGALIMDNYDITADVGAETPVAKTFVTTVSDGVLNLTFSSLTATGGVDQPKVSAIEIYSEGLTAISSSAKIGNLESSGTLAESKDLNLYQVVLHPSPASTIVTINLVNSPAPILDMQIFDQSGKLISITKPSSIDEGYEYTLPVDHLQSGPYILKVRHLDGTVKYVRFMVIH
jgi:PKD repeat protein/N-acetylneuraminic acid mutarotase